MALTPALARSLREQARGHSLAFPDLLACGRRPRERGGAQRRGEGLPCEPRGHKDPKTEVVETNDGINPESRPATNK